MDTRIETIIDAAIETLRATDYMESTISQYQKVFKKLAECSREGICTEEAIEKFISARRPDGKPFEINYQRFRERIARMARDYATYGSFDLSVARNKIRPAELNSKAFADVRFDYARNNKARGLAKGTCNYYERLAVEYLVFLESQKIGSIEQADTASILNFMTNISTRWSGTSTYHLATNFRPFLHYLERTDLAEALKLTNPTREHRTMPMLSEGEEEAIAGVCCSGNILAGDAAITLLALTTGMRSCDIIKLEIGNIDWHSMTATIVQQKTANPLTVPLQTRLAEVLAYYILEERPDSDFSNVFIRQKAPHAPLRDHAAIYAATKRVMATAGVSGGGSRFYVTMPHLRC